MRKKHNQTEQRRVERRTTLFSELKEALGLLETLTMPKTLKAAIEFVNKHKKPILKHVDDSVTIPKEVAKPRKRSSYARMQQSALLVPEPALIAAPAPIAVPRAAPMDEGSILERPPK